MLLGGSFSQDLPIVFHPNIHQQFVRKDTQLINTSLRCQQSLNRQSHRNTTNHITQQSMRSTSHIDQSTVSAAMNDQSIDAKNAKRQDSSDPSYLSKPQKPLKLLKRSSIASAFPWMLIDIYS
jgi:hypothetical protein